MGRDEVAAFSAAGIIGAIDDTTKVHVDANSLRKCAGRRRT